MCLFSFLVFAKKLGWKSSYKLRIISIICKKFLFPICSKTLRYLCLKLILDEQYKIYFKMNLNRFIKNYNK